MFNPVALRYIGEVAGYVFVDEFLPILISRRVAPADAASVTELLDGVERYLEASRGKIAFVYDAGDAPGGMPDAGARSVTGRWFAAQEKLLAAKCIGIDFAFASAISRGALTAVFWVARPPVPHEIHSSTRDALARALERKGLAGERDLDAMTRAVKRAGR